MSALYTDKVKSTHFFSDKQITYIKSEMNKQYTVGIFSLSYVHLLNKKYKMITRKNKRIKILGIMPL